MFRFVPLVWLCLLLYHCCHGCQTTGEIPDDTATILHIENLIKQFNNKSETYQIQQSLNVSMEIQNAPEIIHHLEYLINQPNDTANYSQTLDDLEIMFSKIGVRGGKGGGGGKTGGGSKTKVGGGGGGTKTRIGGHYYRPNSRSSGGGTGGMIVLYVIGGIAGFFVLGFIIFVIFDECYKKPVESTKM